MAKDINIHLKTQGAAQTKQQLEEVGGASQRVGETVGRGGKRGADGMDKMSQSADKAQSRFGKLGASIKSWVVGLVGITAAISAITRAIRTQIQAIEEHARIASEQQKKLISLQAMGEFYKERPELRKEVAAYAELGRRPFEEVAEAWYMLRSQAGRLTGKQRGGIMTQALELGRMYPEAPLTDLVNMFALYTKATQGRDINRIQNVLLQTITEAGGGMGEVSKFMPTILGPAMAAGLTGPQAAGLWSYVTTLPEAGGVARGTVALRNIFLALQGKGTPESQKMLQQFGMAPGMGFFQQMQMLTAQRQAGRFGLPQAELLAGREGAAMLLGLMAQPQAMRETIANVVGAARGRRDITRETLEGIMGTDEFARLEEMRRLLNIQIANIKGGDPRALKWDVYFKEYEKGMREAGWPEAAIDAALMIERLAGATVPWGVEKRIQSIRREFGEGAIVEGAPVIINDNSMNYYPRVGSDERGPRFTQD